MEISEQGIALIRQFEGFSPKRYLCPAGKPTIGYGHVIKPGEMFAAEITEHEAQELLRADLRHFEETLNTLVQVEVTQGQYDALVSFCYNVGVNALRTSTLLRFLNTGNYAAAAIQFSRWCYINGQPSEGLARRRRAEILRFNA